MTKTLQFIFLLLVATLLWGCADKTQLSSGPSPAASLSGLTISGATLTPAFSPDTLTYTTSVDHATDSITVTPTATDSNATINVNGVVVPTGSTSPPIPLKVGDNTITIVVTEPDGTTKETYTVTVTRPPSIDAALSALTLSSGSLVPAFDTNVLTYSASVAHTTDSITVTPTAHDPDATITVNGVVVDSGTASQAIPLVVGDNTINILVTAQDLTKHTNYVVTVARAPSADALLSALALSEGSLMPAFDPTVLSYTATVPHATDSITVTPTANDPAATIEVDGLPVTSGAASQPQSLAVGPNVIRVDVTAQDGSTTTPYVITVTREASTDASLSALTLSSGLLVPSFDTHVLAYTANVTHETDSIVVFPTATDPNSTITVNGKQVDSGSASDKIKLNVGDNIIDILVTAQDLATHANYRITVTRAPSSIATLSALSLSSGVLTPAFQPTVLNYSATVVYTTDTITVTPTATDPDATIMVNGIHVDSGTASLAFPLTVGKNTINIVVTAADTTTSTNYLLEVTREPSSDAALSDLTVSTGLLKPTSALDFTESVDHAVDFITVTPTADDPAATITLTVKDPGGTITDIGSVTSGTASQAIPLAVGDTLITILVTAQDGVTTTDYTITVTRAPSSVATLSNLTLSSGVLSPAFQPTELTYGATVTNTTAAITVTPTATDSGATITVNGTPVTSGTASQSIPLTVGPINTISIVVTAQDGSTTTTYTLTVIRFSVDATLSDLTLSAGYLIPLKPQFDSLVLNYTGSADSADTQVTVTTTASSPYYSSITVNGVKVNTGVASQPITLVTGDTNINVIVTAQDGVTTQTYIIVVTRPSDDANLSGLSLTAGGVLTPIQPPFETTQLNYTVSVDNATDTVTVTPTAADDGATIVIEGQTVISGQPSDPISISNGVTAIGILVTAEDGKTTKTYTIEVKRPWDGTSSETLNAFYPGAGDQFGYSLAVEGNTLVIGAPAEDSGDPKNEQDNSAQDAGAAFSFQFDPALNGGSGAWTQVWYVKPVSPQAGEAFGDDVAISGNSLVAGAPGYDSNNINVGAAYLFTRSSSSEMAWTQKAILTSPANVTYSSMGINVAIDADTIAARSAETTTGAVHVFEPDANGIWSQVVRLTPSDTSVGGFGNGIAIDGDTMVIGAPSRGEGIAYIFTRDANGDWIESQILSASNADDGDEFGYAVALERDILVVSAIHEDSGDPANEADNSAPDAGAAYVFRRDSSTSQWSQEAYLKSANPGPGTLQRFGRSVAIENGNIAIGADSPLATSPPGYAYVFSRTANGWELISSLNTSAPGADNSFGASIGISGDQVFVGEPREDTNGENSGAAHVFD